MEFHIARTLRERLDLSDVLFSYTGNAVFVNVAASRRLALGLTKLREAAAKGTEGKAPEPVNAGALFAMGLIDELSHAMVASYRRQTDPRVLAEGLDWFAAQTGVGNVDALLARFTDDFPNQAVYHGKQTVLEYLKASTDDPVDGPRPNREAAFEELLLLYLANRNPAFKGFKELFDDTSLREETGYKGVTEKLPDYFVTRPPVAPEIGTLLDALEAPFRQSPDSLTGQLEYIREHWAPFIDTNLDALLKQILLAIDTVREEEIAIWMRFNPPAPDNYRHGAPGFGGEGFFGDEYIGFEDMWETGADGVRRRKRYDRDYQAPLNEYEAFSADQAWMPNVVLIAKSTYVWLEQLSRKYGRHIHRLDHIPDEELRLLQERGMTGLWLIGLWERSTASQKIKRLRGHSDAVASAYSLKEYNIAEDLGGWPAYNDLKGRAAKFKLRLASDMVPNHMGLDSPWVIERPDMFITRWESPFPAYSFNGPDLSSDSRVEIKIDDHYYDQTDAAVAYRVRWHSNGETRYIYHGNDGTTFAWNDTAQLDYSKAWVREEVIKVILHVARLFPIIRFDAAMVLAKRHVQRLWFPLPGVGGSIPSRAESALTDDEFNALVPNEFWREVVDRVAAEVPGTLLLAEAFWMLEGYFVRTLGMHRVYNSAFMNMLRDEENAKYRSYLKKTIEFDPDILKRYVNFMSNPDERTSIDQFGRDDKAFGVATVMSTMPGLPMFGHGQIEGYTERYGMEFKMPKMTEWPDEGLVARHNAEIAPLLHKRHIFAGSENFRLYDFWTGYGTVNENVFAYSNRHGDERSLVFYNNSYTSTDGTIHHSAASMDKGSGELRSMSLHDALGLSHESDVLCAWRDHKGGLEYLRRATDLRDSGFWVKLNGYQYAVLVDWRQMRSTAERPWTRLCEMLNGAGVPDLEQAMAQLKLQPLHEAVRGVLSTANLNLLADTADRARASATEPVTPSTKATEAGGPSFADNGKPATPQSPASAPHTEEAGGGETEAPPSTPAPSTPANLAPLAERTNELFWRWTEQLPSALLKKLTPDTTAAAASFQARLSRSLERLLAMPETARTLSPEWPAQIGSLVPGAAEGIPLERTWAPLLAFVTLRDLPWKGSTQGASNQAFDLLLFDQLDLRTALSESFGSLGLSGEDRWRAAARVRLLLGGAGLNSLHDHTFWSDPDVRWLAGINESQGVLWVNKESFAELACLLAVPSLLTGETASAAGAVAEALEKLNNAGYKLDAYLDGSAPAIPADELVEVGP